jgi:hypothetical protein
MTIGFASLLLCLPIGLQDAPKAEPPSAKTICRDLEYEGVREAYLLAFEVEVDDRPLYVEAALIAVKLDGDIWRLSCVHRHPKEKRKDSNAWRLSVIYDVDQSPSEDYNHRPTEAEVDAFLKHAWWKFAADADGGFRLLQGKVFAETWENVLGYKPKHVFPKP